jgi:hypothetical protein
MVNIYFTILNSANGIPFTIRTPSSYLSHLTYVSRTQVAINKAFIRETKLNLHIHLKTSPFIFSSRYDFMMCFMQKVSFVQNLFGFFTNGHPRYTITISRYTYMF